MRVLITRPATLAQELCEAINALGDHAELCPVIDIRPTLDTTVLQHTMNTLNTFDMAIFVSRYAVQFTLPFIHTYWRTLPSILWLAIGAGTAKDLTQAGIAPVLFPKELPYESESLLALPVLQAITEKKIVIFRGNGGRTLLQDVLQQRGAKVHLIEVYQRCLPTLDLVEKLKNWNYTFIDIMVTTSAECLNNLVELFGKEKDWLKEVPIVVVGSRMYQLAQQLEFKKPLLAKGADNASIIKVLTKFKENLK